MREGTIFPREEKTEVLFQKILNDPWACEKLQETFCNYLFCDDEINSYLSPLEFLSKSNIVFSQIAIKKADKSLL